MATTNFTDSTKYEIERAEMAVNHNLERLDHALESLVKRVDESSQTVRKTMDFVSRTKRRAIEARDDATIKWHSTVDSGRRSFASVKRSAQEKPYGYGIIGIAAIGVVGLIGYLLRSSNRRRVTVASRPDRTTRTNWQPQRLEQRFNA
jgi:hypothetical protein